MAPHGRQCPCGGGDGVSPLVAAAPQCRASHIPRASSTTRCAPSSPTLAHALYPTRIWFRESCPARPHCTESRHLEPQGCSRIASRSACSVGDPMLALPVGRLDALLLNTPRCGCPSPPAGGFSGRALPRHRCRRPVVLRPLVRPWWRRQCALRGGLGMGPAAGDGRGRRAAGGTPGASLHPQTSWL
jgi:hypothetical protein